jgi:hypothetical protein
VLLDIGGDVGALVVTMPAELDGIEVEIRPADAASEGSAATHGPAGHVHHPHVAVVARPTPAGVVHSLVFGEVQAGHYRLHERPDGPVALEVDVTGGEVTQVSWTPAA